MTTQHKSALEEGAYTPVFVGGMARSGTTMLSALVSTSRSCNPFAPELHCLGMLGQAMTSLALPSQDVFFKDRETLVAGHMDLMRRVLDQAWSSANRPSFMVVKQCSLTPLFGLMARHMPRARFLVIFRDARDVIASMVRARAPAGMTESGDNWLLQSEIDRWIRLFNGYYGAIVSVASGDLQGRVLPIEHERLCKGHIEPVAEFLELPDIDPNELWSRASFDLEAFKKDPMFSSGWGRPLGQYEVRSYRDVLCAQTAARVHRDTLKTSVGFRALVELATVAPGVS